MWSCVARTPNNQSMYTFRWYCNIDGDIGFYFYYSLQGASSNSSGAETERESDL
jgi:hypothetical protein